jgi:hypothetical protein
VAFGAASHEDARTFGHIAVEDQRRGVARDGRLAGDQRGFGFDQIVFAERVLLRSRFLGSSFRRRHLGWIIIGIERLRHLPFLRLFLP